MTVRLETALVEVHCDPGALRARANPPAGRRRFWGEFDATARRSKHRRHAWPACDRLPAGRAGLCRASGRRRGVEGCRGAGRHRRCAGHRHHARTITMAGSAGWRPVSTIFPMTEHWRSMQTMLEFETRGPGLYEITRDVARVVAGQGDGLLTLLIQHTSASLLIQEKRRSRMCRVISPGSFRASCRGPTIRRCAGSRTRRKAPTTCRPISRPHCCPYPCRCPSRDGRLVLGTWQGIYLVEHRDRPHERRVAAHFAPDRAAG